jgi:hypothetical protein
MQSLKQRAILIGLGDAGVGFAPAHSLGWARYQLASM